MSDPIVTFREEAAEHLICLEEVLLELESSPEDLSLVNTAFRSIHTIKGSGSMFGFEALTQFTHHLETALDHVRKGMVPVSQDLISVVLESLDHIQLLLDELNPSQAQLNTGNELLNRLHAVTGEQPVDSKNQTVVTEEQTVQDNTESTQWHIYFKPSQSSFIDGFDVGPILRELNSLGQCKVTANGESLPVLADLDPEQSYLSFDVLLESSATFEDIHDVFMFVAEDWTISIEVDKRPEQSAQVSLIDEGDMSAEAPQFVSDSKQPAKQPLKEDKNTANQDVSVRVPARKLDILMDLVGELVITQARMSQVSHQVEDERIAAIAEELERLTTNLRDNTFEIRMLPIGTTFSRFKRLVRDLSKELKKDIRLITEGAETELDKMVIDSLADPLVHLIRNSVDHGIESVEVRQKTGKPKEGTIHLSARHAESSVMITITDDGAGLDAEKIYNKAVERHIISAGQHLSEKECYQLIFEPGFSTAAQVSDISGRGVGMDVVKRSIQDLRGEVRLDSAKGKGTTITIRLPMTLAIIEGLIVSVGKEVFVFPLSHVEECVELTKTEIHKDRSKDVDLIPIRGELLPFLRLREWFECPGETPDIEQIVIVHHDNTFFGFSVDQIIGQQQVVIKNLGTVGRKQTNFAGATITGDGGVAMIIDVDQTIKEFSTKTYQSHLPTKDMEIV